MTSWPWVLMFLRRLLRVQPNPHSSRGRRENNVYMSIWDFYLLPNAFQSMQCPCDISTLYVKLILLHSQKIFRDLYGWFLHLLRLIQLMSSQSRTCPQTIHWEEFDIELRKVPLHTTWDCPRSRDFQERDWYEQSKDRCHNQASHTQMCERYPIFLRTCLILS